MKINGFAYDSETQTYCRTQTNSELNADGTTSTKTIKLPIDQELNEKIKELAEISKKGEKFNLEQLKFLYIHKNDHDIAPEISKFNRDYLNNLRETIDENRRAELIAAQEVTNRWSSLLNESHDPFTAFLFSFMTAYSKHKEDLVREATKLDFAITTEENKTQNEAIAKFLNALDFKEGDVKIIHIETADSEQIKVIKTKEDWSNLANDEAFKSLITDEKSQTSIYSTTAEKFKDFEEKLASAENKKSVLNENLGTPDAQKTYGESTKEGVEFSQKMRHDASSEESKASEQKKEHTESKSPKEGEKEKRTSKKTKLPIEEMLAQKDTIKIPSREQSIEGNEEKKSNEGKAEDQAETKKVEQEEKKESVREEKRVDPKIERLEEELQFIYSQDVAKLKESGDFDKLLQGEKITILSPDKAISADIAIVEEGNRFQIMSGNLQVHAEEKLSERQKELLEPAGKLHLMPYMNEKEKREWQTVSEDNIPDQIGGHSVTNQEKKALLKGEVIVLTDCTENSPNQKPYTAEVHATLKKSENGIIKPVMSVNPKGFSEKQSKGEKQSEKQDQKQVKTKKQGIKI